MKGVLPDSEEWRFHVQGDWRGKVADGGTYETTPQGKFVTFGGAVGFYAYLKGEWSTALDAWNDEVETIEALERDEGQRYHKGWFYWQIAQCYRQLGQNAAYLVYLDLVREEDRLSYGEKAADFPASGGDT